MSESAPDRYLEAFLDGLEFALLAAEGRLGNTPQARAFLADYRRILAQSRANKERPREQVIRMFGRIIHEADVEPLARN